MLAKQAHLTAVTKSTSTAFGMGGGKLEPSHVSWKMPLQVRWGEATWGGKGDGRWDEPTGSRQGVILAAVAATESKPRCQARSSGLSPGRPPSAILLAQVQVDSLALHTFTHECIHDCPSQDAAVLGGGERTCCEPGPFSTQGQDLRMLPPMQLLPPNQ